MIIFDNDRKNISLQIIIMTMSTPSIVAPDEAIFRLYQQALVKALPDHSTKTQAQQSSPQNSESYDVVIAGVSNQNCLHESHWLN
jgi:hypothetical protein